MRSVRQTRIAGDVRGPRPPSTGGAAGSAAGSAAGRRPAALDPPDSSESECQPPGTGPGEGGTAGYPYVPLLRPKPGDNDSPNASGTLVGRVLRLRTRSYSLSLESSGYGGCRPVRER